ncbi:MAG: class I SAM-dependent methyltransferase [bacterium]
MRRVHLFEVGEQSWCPSALRDGLTDYLTFMIEHGQPYASAAPLLATAMLRTPTPPAHVVDVVDLAAGAGGPWKVLVEALAEVGVPVRVRLTDRYPNLDAYARLSLATNDRVTGEPRPVSADAVPPELVGFRTMFSAFHHFAPADARRVLADAAARGRSIAIFEAMRRDVRAVLLMCLVPIFVLLSTPFIRPLRLSRLLLTYLLPVIPLVAMFDGIVSCLRTYTPAELLAIAQKSAPDGYAWTAGEVGKGPIPVTYLLLEPNAPSQQRDGGVETGRAVSS